MKLWGGRFEKDTAKEVEEFSSSILTDAKMWSADIKASIAHARMLGAKNIIPQADSEKIIKGLLEIAEEISIENGPAKYTFNPKAEDLHSEIADKAAAVDNGVRCVRPDCRW